MDIIELLKMGAATFINSSKSGDAGSGLDIGNLTSALFRACRRRPQQYRYRLGLPGIKDGHGRAWCCREILAWRRKQRSHFT